MSNIILQHRDVAAIKDYWQENKDTLSIPDMWRKHVAEYCITLNPNKAPTIWYQAVQEWEAEEEDEDKTNLFAMDDEAFEEEISKTKREVFILLKGELKKLQIKSLKTEKILDERILTRLQNLFDSLWKQENAREEILLKKRKENRADAMAVFDVYGRFGVPDSDVLESMRQALYGHVERPKQLGTARNRGGDVEQTSAEGEGVTVSEDSVVGERQE